MLKEESKLYKTSGFWWQPATSRRGGLYLDGPFCALSSCYGRIKYVGPNSEYVECTKCGRKEKAKENHADLRQMATEKFEAYKRSECEKISIDEPPTGLSVRDVDENYFLAARIGQKDGQRVGVVYFGEKNKNQKKDDYSQIFIDIDDEQLRFDKSNKHPKDILVKFKAEFPHVEIDQKFDGKRVIH